MDETLSDMQDFEKQSNKPTVIKFEPNLKERMQCLVYDGQYGSLNELIRDAVRHLVEAQRERIDRMIQEQATLRANLL